MSDEKVMTFRAWLTRQTGRQDPVGDLARDACTDRGWRTARALRARLPAELEDQMDRAMAEYANTNGGGADGDE